MGQANTHVDWLGRKWVKRIQVLIGLEGSGSNKYTCRLVGKEMGQTDTGLDWLRRKWVKQIHVLIG